MRCCLLLIVVLCRICFMRFLLFAYRACHHWRILNGYLTGTHLSYRNLSFHGISHRHPLSGDSAQSTQGHPLTETKCPRRDSNPEHTD